MKTKEKYTAILIGCGIGDCLGMPVEAWSKEHIQKYIPRGKVTCPIAPLILKDNKGNIIKKDEYGEIKYYTRDLCLGEYTDDTILTIAIAESIIQKQKLDLEDICKKQVQAYKKCKQKDGHVRGGFGGTTKRAFENLLKGTSVYKSGISPGLGNGPIMKISPIGIYMHATSKYNLGIKVSEQVAKATHKDKRAIAGAVVQAHAIYTLLKNNISKQEFLNTLIQCCEENEQPLSIKDKLYERGSLLSKLKWISQNNNTSNDNAFSKLGNSALAFESYPFSLFMFQKYWNNPLDGLIETINYGGDCDTTGAIYGTLTGAKHGNIFPQKWIKTLKDSEKLRKLGGEIYKLIKI
jgi:ADP-ribosylglycohydrolase